MTSERLLRLKRLTDKHEGHSDFSFTAETKLFICLPQKREKKKQESMWQVMLKRGKVKRLFEKVQAVKKHIFLMTQGLYFSQNDIVSNVRALISLIFKWAWISIN